MGRTVYLPIHEWLKSYGKCIIGKYNSPMDPMGNVASYLLLHPKNPDPQK